MQPLPPAPTRPALCKRTFSPHHSPRAAGGPRGLAQLGARGQGGKGAQGLSGPTEAEEGKGNCRAVAQHKMRQQSKGQTARNHLAEERGHKCTVPGRPRADHRGRGRRVETRSDTDPKGERKPYVEHRPLRRAGEIYGRAGTVGHRARGGRGAQGEGARWTQEVASNGAHSRPFQSGWWQQGGKNLKPKANSRDMHGASRVTESGEARLGSAPGSKTPVPGCEHSRRRAGPVEGVRELRHTAAAQGGAGRGKERRGAPRNSAPFAPAGGGVASRHSGGQFRIPKPARDLL